ncbi:hypothetical protein LR48_Vigan252s002200 [Vigna angularis]|uniref:Uncharacterized protein n=1 Tax=Phaseolus angularis TaxID=3914 RepID=A0A0L9T6T0_PHAAN|nr:hypothetical protein LR48_Vigan252s002200 [Vigna angularis]
MTFCIVNAVRFRCVWKRRFVVVAISAARYDFEEWWLVVAQCCYVMVDEDGRCKDGESLTTVEGNHEARKKILEKRHSLPYHKSDTTLDQVTKPVVVPFNWKHIPGRHKGNGGSEPHPPKATSITPSPRLPPGNSTNATKQPLERENKAANKFKSSNKSKYFSKLNINALLIYVRRASAASPCLTEARKKILEKRHSLPYHKSDTTLDQVTKPVVVPFNWKHIPGRHKGNGGSEPHPPKATSITPSPRLPPGNSTNATKQPLERENKAANKFKSSNKSKVSVAKVETKKERKTEKTKKNS